MPSLLPLAVRMRPRTLGDVIGQDKLLQPGSPLRRLIEDDAVGSFILYGPAGAGKTTVARIVAATTKRQFVELSATSAGVKDVRDAVALAEQNQAQGRGTVLFVDEVHRFNKAQQDVLLPVVENRLVTFIGATTENPSFSVNGPLLSRSLVLMLEPLSDEAVRIVLHRALDAPEGLDHQIGIGPNEFLALTDLSNGDARRALTYLEEAAETAKALNPGHPVVTAEIVSQVAGRALVVYDQNGDQHYDVVSAFIKSMRGSDPDAALHYLARMLVAGEDPRYVARRIMIHASEDVGMADPSVLPLAVAAAQGVQLVGMPEAQIILAHAVIAVATSPKSNAVVAGIGAAMADVQAGRSGVVPPHLRDSHYQSASRYGAGVGYLYPHDFPHGVVAQQYLPDTLVGTRYFTPTTHGHEAVIKHRIDIIRGES